MSASASRIVAHDPFALGDIEQPPVACGAFGVSVAGSGALGMSPVIGGTLDPASGFGSGGGIPASGF